METKALKLIALFSFMAILLGAFGCSLLDFFPTETVLRGIARPHVWAGLSLKGYKIEWPGGAGGTSELWIEARTFEEGYAFEVAASRLGKTLVFAYPTLADGRTLMPAAVLYPFDLDDEGRGVFSYVSGYEAEVALVLEKAGRNPWAYPIERLGDEIAMQGKDPWDSAPWNTVALLMSGKFRLNSFPGKKYRFDLPEGRLWLPTSPFAELCADENGSFVILADGISAFVSSDASLWVSCQGGIFSQAVRLCHP